MTVGWREPRALGLDPDRWRQVDALAAELCQTGRLPGVVLQIVRADGATLPICHGALRHSPAREASTLTPEAIFLTASLSKPLVAMGVLRLVEQGRLALSTRVSEILPECEAAPKRPMTVRHLLTHTSGLPDMLPNNRPLRQSQAPLSAFVSGACAVTLDFPPGRGVQYQSLGYALLGEIVERIAGRSCGAFLADELFAPLGMVDTVLGASGDWFQGTAPRVERIAEVRVPEDQAGGDEWNWNSRYWRTLGAPWGGVLSTSADLVRFLQLMLNRGSIDGQRLFAPATIEAATTNQLEALHDVPEADRRTRGWGLGWRLNWTAHSATFGDLLPSTTYGHWGATGTLWWVDPVRQVGLVLLSTQSLDRGASPLLQLSNAAAAVIV